MPTINGTVGRRPDKYKFWIEYSYTQNISNNTTTITAISYLSVYYYAFSGKATRSVTINGVSSSSSASLAVSNNTPTTKTVEVHRNTQTVTHNSDGTKSVVISATLNCDAGGYGTGYCSANATVTLPTIPRASSVTASNANIGMSCSITISRASSIFTHKLYYSCSGVSKTLITSGVGTSYQWTIPTSIYQHIPTQKSVTITIYCDTYNGSTLVGSKSTTMTGYVTNSNPIVSLSILKDINSTSLALTGNENVFIKGVSDIKVKFIPNAQNGASILSTVINCSDGQAASTNDTTFYQVKGNSFICNVVDSRGFSTSAQASKTMINYFNPVATKVNFYRESSTSSNIYLDYNISWFNGDFGATRNTCTIKLRWRDVGGTWSNYQTLSPTISSNTASGNILIGSNYSYENAFDFEFVITDKIKTVVISKQVSQGIPIVDIGKNQVCINGGLICNSANVDGLEVITEGIWHDVPLLNGVTVYRTSEFTPKIRRLGSMVQLKGAVTNLSGSGLAIASIPTEFIPSKSVGFAGIGTNVDWIYGALTYRYEVTTYGQLLIYRGSDNRTWKPDGWYPLDFIYAL